ncbi:MAG: patatin-like phospholipase family protein [Chloroflexota bacterium]|nr:patatin-like phospholipase family protein [Chloroflexota bacterium]
MKPFREHVAIAIDGGGIRGVIVAQALAILEEHLGQSSHDVFRLAAGTSTGSIISACIGVGLNGAEIHRLYCELGETIFRQTWRARLWPLTRYRYPHEPLEAALGQFIGEITMADFWSADPPTDVVITTFDLVDNRTRFVKPWKEEYAGWPVVRVVLASCSVPTCFPPVEGRYVDGGVGAYTNPCYLAAYEARFCLEWDPAKTTLISLGTGRDPHTLQPGDTDRFWAWEWIEPVLGGFLQSADDQQVHLVRTFFEQLDFRRFQVDLREPIGMDDPSKIPELCAYGDKLGRKILNDETDRALEILASRAPRQL